MGAILISLINQTSLHKIDFLYVLFRIVCFTLLWTLFPFMIFVYFIVFVLSTHFFILSV